MRLTLGNKNYSSWSVRPYFFVRQAGIPCQERVMPLDEPGFGDAVAKASPSARVPFLELDDGTVVWDSLAIGLTLGELFPESRAFPEAPRLRRLAWSACAEMHAGFADMRRVLTCNERRRYAKDQWRRVAGGPEIEGLVLADVRRIETLFATLLNVSGGPFLCGDFGYVDAYFVPVISRFRTYDIDITSTTEAYAGQLEALPTHAAWRAEAAAEPNVIEKYEYPLERR